jgi:hypothetical protein
LLTTLPKRTFVLLTDKLSKLLTFKNEFLLLFIGKILTKEHYQQINSLIIVIIYLNIY